MYRRYRKYSNFAILLFTLTLSLFEVVYAQEELDISEMDVLGEPILSNEEVCDLMITNISAVFDLDLLLLQDPKELAKMLDPLCEINTEQEPIDGKVVLDCPISSGLGKVEVSQIVEDNINFGEIELSEFCQEQYQEFFTKNWGEPTKTDDEYKSLGWKLNQPFNLDVLGEQGDISIEVYPATILFLSPEGNLSLFLDFLE